MSGPSGEVISRSELTSELFNWMRADLDGAVLVGRGVAPADGGWSGGEAGQGTWVDYTVLKTGRATTPAPGEPERLGVRRTSWLCTYSLTHHSTRESLADELGDTVRISILSYAGRTMSLSTADWTVQYVTIPELGASVRDDSTDPAHWSITDAVSLHLSRVSVR